MYDWLIVGAGFAGSVLAERLASAAQRAGAADRPARHIGGNAYDRYDEAGVLIHQYGPHIFHTNSKQIFDYLSQFTDWRPYEHRVLAEVDGKLVPIPINLDTVNTLYGLTSPRNELEDWFAARAEPVAEIRTSEDVVVSAVGPRALREVLPRLHPQAMGPRPLRARQVGDRARADPHQPRRPLFQRQFQFMPKHGYTRMFETHARPSEHQRHAQTDYDDVQRRRPASPRHLHRADRRVSSASASASCPIARCASST